MCVKIQNLSIQSNCKFYQKMSRNKKYGKPDHPLPTETRYQDEDLYKKSASVLAKLHLNVKHSKNFH